MDAAESLAEALGISKATASRLLSEADGDADAAAAMHFASVAEAQQAAQGAGTSHARQPGSRRAQQQHNSSDFIELLTSSSEDAPRQALGTARAAQAAAAAATAAAQQAPEPDPRDPVWHPPGRGRRSTAGRGRSAGRGAPPQRVIGASRWQRSEPNPGDAAAARGVASAEGSDSAQSGDEGSNSEDTSEEGAQARGGLFNRFLGSIRLNLAGSLRGGRGRGRGAGGARGRGRALGAAVPAAGPGPRCIDMDSLLALVNARRDDQYNSSSDSDYRARASDESSAESEPEGVRAPQPAGGGVPAPARPPADRAQLHDRPLDTGVIATAKARQPPLPLPPSRLPMLPLKEHRLPDVQGGGLMCADPDAVPANRVLPAGLKEPTGYLQLGTLRLPWLPRETPPEALPADGKSPSKSKATSQGAQELKTVAGLLHSGALPIKDVSVFASSNIYDDHSDTGLLCRAEKLRDALVKAGVVPKVKHAGSTVSDLPKSEAHIHVGRLPWDHFFLYNAIGELYRRCPTEDTCILKVGVQRIVDAHGVVIAGEPYKNAATDAIPAVPSTSQPAKKASPAKGARRPQAAAVGKKGKAAPAAAPADTPAVPEPNGSKSRASGAAKEAAGSGAKQDGAAAPLPGAAANGSTDHKDEGGKRKRKKSEKQVALEALGAAGDSRLAKKAKKGAADKGEVKKGQGEGPAVKEEQALVDQDAGGEADDKAAAGPSTSIRSPTRGGKKGATDSTKPDLNGPLYIDLSFEVNQRNLIENCSIDPPADMGRDTKPGRVRNPAGGATIGTAIANIITSLLTYGQGLWVGPDSDGACNLGLDVGNTNSNMPQPGDLPAQTAAGAVAPASQPQSQVEGSQAQVPASGPGWKDTVVCGLTVCELAQQATPEVLRLRTKVQACSQAEKAAAAQLTRARRALTTRQKAVTEQGGAASFYVKQELTGLAMNAATSESALGKERASLRGAQTSLALAERAAAIFAAAGLCAPPPAPPPPPPPPAPRQANTGGGRGKGVSKAGGQGGADGTGGAGNGPQGADPMDVDSNSREGSDNDPSADGAAPRQEGQGEDAAAASAPDAAAGPSAGAKSKGKKGGGKADAGAKSAPGAAQPGSSGGEGGDGSEAPDGNAPAPTGPVPPPLGGVPLALLLAAEVVSGETLVKRDPRSGWVMVADAASAGSEAAVQGRERLNGKVFGVQQLLNSVAPPEDTEAAVPHAIKSHPKHFQLQGLHWMLARERKSDAVSRGVLHLHPNWIQLVTGDGTVFYLSRLSPYGFTFSFTPAPVGGTCGGFLCDEMGLGKTLQTLMLVLSNPAPEGWAVRGAAHAPPTDDDPAIPIRTTLLVMPSNLVSQWIDEIEAHVEPGALKWAVYESGDLSLASATADILEPAADTNNDQEEEEEAGRGGSRCTRRSRTPSLANLEQEGNQGVAGQSRGRRGAAAAERTGPTLRPKQDSKQQRFALVRAGRSGHPAPISEVDVVLMSYEQLRKELTARNCPLLRYGFWRICLDEAQLVANTSSVAAQMASSLWRRHAWVVTGTPISARMSEIQGLCEFLSAEPFYHTSSTWRHILQMPYEGRSRGGLLAVRDLLRTVMLRRSKAQVEDQLSLPPCTREDRFVKLSRTERAFYDNLRKEYIQALNALVRASRAAQNSGNSGRNTQLAGKALAALTALRQCCCHPQIVKRTENKNSKQAQRMSMRQIMSRLVLEAYQAYDASVGQWMSARMLAAAYEDLYSPFPGELALRELLAHLRALHEVAEEVDIHAASERRTHEGGVIPLMEEQLRERQLKKDQEMAAQLAVAEEQQQQEQEPQPAPAPPAPEGTVVGSTAAGNEGPSVPVDGSAGTSATAAAQSADAAAATSVEVKAEGSAAGTLQKPSAAAAPTGEGGGGSDGGEANADAKNAVSLVEEEEQKRAADAAKDRVRRWQRLECDLLTLITYVIRKKHPPAVQLAAVMAAEAAAAAAKTQGTAGGNQGSGAGPSAPGNLAAVPGASQEDADLAAAIAASVADASKQEGPLTAAAGEGLQSAGIRNGTATTVQADSASAALASQLLAPPAGAQPGTAAGDTAAAGAPAAEPEPAQPEAAAQTAMPTTNGRVTRKRRAGSGSPVEPPAAEGVQGPGHVGPAKRARVTRRGSRAPASPVPAAATVQDTAAAAEQDTRAGDGHIEAKSDAAQEQKPQEPNSVALASADASPAAGPGAAGPSSGSPAAHQRAGPSSSAGGDLQGEGAQQKAGPSLAEEEGEAEMRVAAQRMVEAREQINALRLEMGLPPVLDVDNAELRRSKRNEERAQTAAETEAARRAAGLNSEGDSSEEEDLDDFIDSEDDDDVPARGPASAKARRERAAAKRTKQEAAKLRKASANAAKRAPEAALDVFLRSEVIVRSFESQLAKKKPLESLSAEVERLHKVVGKDWHELKHKLHTEAEALAASNQQGGGEGNDNSMEATPAPGEAIAGGSSGNGNGNNDGRGRAAGPSTSAAVPVKAEPAGTSTGAQAAAAALAAAVDGAERGEGTLCPICLDEPERRTIASCGHAFCSECIREIVPSSGSGPCPICRKPLRRTDLIDTISEAEAEAIRAQEQMERGSLSANADYGAKVAALLDELAAMEAKEPGSKAVVFSSWSRLLRLVSDALAANNVRYASLAVASPEKRQAALASFNRDPSCRVLLLLMSSSSGAAGLTLTVASTAFILEPSVNPGLEAQAAARIYRLGQTKPTRVIRLLAERTVETQVLALQRHKLQSGHALQPEGAGASTGTAGGEGQDEDRQDPEAAAAAAGGRGGRRGQGGRGGANRGEEEGGEALGALTQELDSRMLFRFFGAEQV